MIGLGGHRGPPLQRLANHVREPLCGLPNLEGENLVRRNQKIILAMTFINIFILVGITLMDPIAVNGQSKERTILSQERGKDPFLLPSGIHLLSKIDTASGTKGISSKTDSKPNDMLPSPLKVKAILISDHVRLALIDRHIVTAGDSIQDEKVLEIKTDRVILGKGDQKRTLLLSQSPVLLTVEERPPTLTLPHKGERKEGGKGE